MAPKHRQDLAQALNDADLAGAWTGGSTGAGSGGCCLHADMAEPSRRVIPIVNRRVRICLLGGVEQRRADHSYPTNLPIGLIGKSPNLVLTTATLALSSPEPE